MGDALQQWYYIYHARGYTNVWLLDGGGGGDRREGVHRESLPGGPDDGADATPASESNELNQLHSTPSEADLLYM